jgi:hypothetical protein
VYAFLNISTPGKPFPLPCKQIQVTIKGNLLFPACFPSVYLKEKILSKSLKRYIFSLETQKRYRKFVSSIMLLISKKIIDTVDKEKPVDSQGNSFFG